MGFIRGLIAVNEFKKFQKGSNGVGGKVGLLEENRYNYL
jgi:hypothetical protein